MKKLMFLLVVMFALASVAVAQNIATAVNVAEFTVTNGLVVTCTGGQVGDLAPGLCYDVKTNGDINPPDAAGNTNIGFMSWNATGQIGGLVTVSFNLPTQAYDPNVGVGLPITYGPFDGVFDNTGTVDGLTGNAFDVRVPYSDYIGANGAVDVFVGYRICVPVNAPAGDYFANFYGTFAATGL
jgi:hypothetical protein